MKKIILVIMSIVLLSSSSIAKTPPTAVQKAFEKKFPTATKVSWGKESAKEWEAEFVFEGSKISANFSEDGTWIETEMEIKVADLPVAVGDAVKSKYPGWKISGAEKTETSKHGSFYEVDLKMGLKKKSVAYKEDGTPVNE